MENATRPVAECGTIPSRRGPRPKPVEERFWAKVEKSDGCWLWTAGLMKNGYALFLVTSTPAVRKLAHRFAYELLVGPIPDSLDLDHKCHRRHCVNPQHLQPVSRTLNNENRRSANRNSTTGVRGVAWDASRQRYQAKVTHDRRTYFGGRFERIEDAEAAAIALRNRLMTNNLLDREPA